MIKIILNNSNLKNLKSFCKKIDAFDGAFESGYVLYCYPFYRFWQMPVRSTWKRMIPWTTWCRNHCGEFWTQKTFNKNREPRYQNIKPAMQCSSHKIKNLRYVLILRRKLKTNCLETLRKTWLKIKTILSNDRSKIVYFGFLYFNIVLSFSTKLQEINSYVRVEYKTEREAQDPNRTVLRCLILT